MTRASKRPVKVGDRFIDYRDPDVVMQVREIFDYGPIPKHRRKFKLQRRDRSVLLEPVGWTKVRHRLMTEQHLLQPGHTEFVRETPAAVAHGRTFRR